MHSFLERGQERRLHLRGRFVSHEVDVRCGDVREAGFRKVVPELDVRRERGASDRDRNRRERVRRERQRSGSVRFEEALVLLVPLHHVVRVSVVRGEQEHAAELIHDVEKLLHARVALFARRNRRGEVARVPDHVRVREVHANDVVLFAPQRLLARGANLARFHQRRLVERNVIGRNLDVRLEVFLEVPGAVAVPEERDVPEFLRLRARERSQTVRGEHLPGRPLDEGRGYEVVRGEFKVAIVLHESGESNFRISNAVEAVKVRVLERLGDFHDAVGAEVRDDDGVVVLHGPHGLAVRVGDDERFDVLVAVAAFLQFVQRFDRVRELVRRVPEDVRLPPALDHRPVRFVSIHRDLHASAAGRDLGVASLELREVFDEDAHVLVAAVVRDVATVGEDVQPELLASVRDRALAELQDLVVPRVHAAGGEERDDVERVVRESGLDVRPTGAGVHALRF
mmetsp:Transcript_561/g.1781  ORF Transcript_561/g.1781 Transcript_561/m.1781 type:complete len:455 (-) Transcript_561:358-1722(-)